MKLTRRKFIVISLVSGLILIANYLFFFKSFEKLAILIILHDTKSLGIDISVYNEFIQEARDKNMLSNYFPKKHQKLIIVHYYFGKILPFLPYSQSYKLYRSKLVGLFLLSTDYFINKMDSARVIKYTYLYNPYKHFCSNPFSSSNYSY